MSLIKYRQKRKFGQASRSGSLEPKGKTSRIIRRGSKSQNDLSYVIQKHDASKLHYDLRLEMNGVLKSWAVPKGPSLDPEVKRLAIEVEDHPLEYQSFEGIIPKGQYGGGTVMVWDMGRWKPKDNPEQAYRQGDMTFQILGKKLHGLWKLIKIKSKTKPGDHDWLFFKLQDKYAKKEGDITIAKPLSALTRRSLEKISGAKNKNKRRSRDE